MTPGSGANNTLAPTTLCDSDRIRIQFSNVIFSNIFGNLASTANDQILSTSEYLIFYITISSTANFEMPVLHHEYIFATGVYTYNVSASMVYPVGKTAFLPSQPLASTVTISTISSNRDGVT